MNIITLIPARVGSKGVPLKNIRDFDGRPLICRAIDESLKSPFIKDTYVSTDSDLIASIALQSHAKVIKRPDELSSDTATTNSIIEHTIKFLQDKKENIDILVLLQCTAPFLKVEDINGCIQKMLDENSDSCIAVTKFRHFLWNEDSENSATGINHDGRIRKRRQDIKPQYIELGSVYVMKVEAFLKDKITFCGKVSLFDINNDERAFEIDTPNDFYLAEQQAKWLKLTDEEKEFYKNYSNLSQVNTNGGGEMSFLVI